MRLNKIIILAVSVSLINSCIEPFMPKSINYNESMFIQGSVTDNPEMPPTVKISRTVPVVASDDYTPGTKPEYVNGAFVYLYCDDGNEYILEQVGDGIYQLEDATFVGEAGKAYKILIAYGGEKYESDYETLIESPPIDSITYKVVETKISDDGQTVMGYKFYVSTHDDKPTPSFFRWMVDIVYHYKAPFLSNRRWIDNNLFEMYNYDVQNCWTTEDIGNVFVGNTKDMAENEIIEAPLHFQSQYGDALSHRYCVHVKQMSVSEQCYSFWKDLNTLINQTGGLYEIQPFSLYGNIECTSNPDENVAGIFEVAGVSEEREYFLRPTEFKIFTYKCSLDTMYINDENFSWDNYSSGTHIFYDMIEDIYLTSDLVCFDCTARGGENVMPSFWEY